MNRHLAIGNRRSRIGDPRGNLPVPGRRLPIAAFLRCIGGAAAVEFAIICPLIIMGSLGVFETGRALYVRNHVDQACAAGARAVAVSGATSDSAIEAAVRAEFSADRQDEFEVNLTNETIAGRAFKKIEVVYEHDYVVKFGRHLSGLTLTVSRYAAATS
jgi:Flp pilus assembly protein TadG